MELLLQSNVSSIIIPATDETIPVHSDKDLERRTIKSASQRIRDAVIAIFLNLVHNSAEAHIPGISYDPGR